MIKLTDKQKELYVQEYLYDELCVIDLNDKGQLLEHFGTTDLIDIIQGVIAYPLSHNTLDDMYNHMDDKYFHLCTNEQVKAWEESRQI